MEFARNLVTVFNLEVRFLLFVAVDCCSDLLPEASKTRLMHSLELDKGNQQLDLDKLIQVLLGYGRSRIEIQDFHRGVDFYGADKLDGVIDSIPSEQMVWVEPAPENAIHVIVSKL